MQKLYPFSIQKHGHDLEFRRNRLLNTMDDMGTGVIPWDEKEYDRMDSEIVKMEKWFLCNGFQVEKEVKSPVDSVSIYTGRENPMRIMAEFHTRHADFLAVWGDNETRKAIIKKCDKHTIFEDKRKG